MDIDEMIAELTRLREQYGNLMVTNPDGDLVEELSIDNETYADPQLIIYTEGDMH